MCRVSESIWTDSRSPARLKLVGFVFFPSAFETTVTFTRRLIPNLSNHPLGGLPIKLDGRESVCLSAT